jgi:hypothetical protein
VKGGEALAVETERRERATKAKAKAKGTAMKTVWSAKISTVAALCGAALAAAAATGCSGAAPEDEKRPAAAAPQQQRAPLPAPALEVRPSECDAPPEPGQCDGAQWSDRSAVHEGASGERLASVTPDGLVAAWTKADGTVVAASRDTADERFGEGEPLPGGPFAGGRVALSPDGLRAIGVDASGRRFVELVRDARDAAFELGDGAALATLNAHAGYYGFAGESYGDPVIAGDDLSLYFSRYGAAGVTKTLQVARRASPSDPWSLGEAVEGSGIEGTETARKIPTGVSGDGRTLFVVDVATGRSSSVSRGGLACPFDRTRDLGDRAWATPNATCETLFFSAPSGAGAALCEETR